MVSYLSRESLEHLTGFVQPSRQCEWLTRHGWVFVAPERKGERPKVSQAYHDARMLGTHAVNEPLKADMSWMFKKKRAA